MTDPAFVGAGKKVGLEMWRIEKLKPQKVKAEDYGKFYSGDSYIVLNTKCLPGKSALEWDIHFWLGATSSQDEMGVAAYKTVELDDSLGGGPVQYREVQEHESAQFLRLFKGGVQYMDGGIDSGFRKVERDVYETRLLHVKGRKAARVKRVECKATSLNSGDVFILDLGLTLIQWNGSECHRLEKAKALDVITNIKNEERGGKAKIIVIDQGQETDEFWTGLGGKGAIAGASAGGDDEAHEKGSAGKLYELADDGKTTAIPGELTKDTLNTNKVYIIDFETELYLWLGKGASAESKKQAMVNGNKYLAANNKPNWVPLARVSEGTESPLFKSKFKGWQDAPKGAMKSLAQAGNVAKVEQKAVDVKALAKKQAIMEQEKMKDDGTGKIEIWRVEDFKPVEWPKEKHGQFYAGDSFVMKYSYKNELGKDAFIIYFWQGRDSSQDEKGASALIAKDMDDQLKGAACQVRVVQGKEPNHFLCLFKGKMVIHDGGKASGFKNSTEADTKTSGTALYHIRGTTPLNTRAVQVEAKAKSLNSGDCFVLIHNEASFCWVGKGAAADEKRTAVNVADLLSGKRKVSQIDEGTEKDDFWGPLGGKSAYADAPELGDASREPRLFQCSNASGSFKVEELFNFNQDDLDRDDVFLLDTYNEVFVWVGAGSNETERKQALLTAVGYVEHAEDGRSKDTPIYRINAGYEPPNFTCHFLGWDAALAASNEDPYERKLREMNGGAAPAAQDARAALADYSKKYSYKDLSTRNIPSTVDQGNLENYMEDKEFQEVFKMSRAELAAMPKWKREGLKKAAKLF
jgi:advillin